MLCNFILFNSFFNKCLLYGRYLGHKENKDNVIHINDLNKTDRQKTLFGSMDKKLYKKQVGYGHTYILLDYKDASLITLCLIVL